MFATIAESEQTAACTELREAKNHRGDGDGQDSCGDLSLRKG
jgi:hypothetical protein